MDKAAQLQAQIRENNNELTDFLKDLTRWEEKVKDEDKNLKTCRKLEEKLPPIRSKIKKPKVAVDDNKIKDKKKKVKQDPISSYDYDAWSKFDENAACEDGSDEENEDDSGEEMEENDEELQRIQQEKRLQKALMEKEKGNQLFKEGKYEAAINRYTMAINLDSTNPILYANRGMALIKTEKYGAAEQDCNVALQFDPSYGKAIARRATARKKLKKYEDALEDYTQLLQLEPKNQQASQEIKDIQKLLLANQDNSSQITDNSVIQSKNVVNGEYSKTMEKCPKEHRNRLNKPLKRIHITEVGIDEPNINDKEQKNQLKNDRVLHVGHDISQPIGGFELSVPSTSFMFETVFKRLKNEEENLYLYIKLIPLGNYGKLFHQCIDRLISPFLNILGNFYIRDHLPYHEEMDTFTTIKRFDMAVMFLSSKDKQMLAYLFENLSADVYKYPLAREFLRNLAKKYNMKL